MIKYYKIKAKKAYLMFFTIIILMLFTYLSIFIYETKNISRINIQNQFLYIQAKNHLEFFKKFILNKNLEGINNLKIEDEYFTLEARVNKEETSYKIELFIYSKEKEVSLYESFFKE